MATPAIALRFRDTTFDIDTIEAHRQLLATHGAVWWGWWKKEVEQVDPEAMAHRLRDADAVLLINRASKRCFLAQFERFSKAVDADRVPAYYRGHLSDVAGFFLLTAIDEIGYDPILAERLGEHTFLWLNEKPADGLSHGAATADAGAKSCLLHLSDLHFGSDYGFRVQREKLPVGDNRLTLTESIVADLERLGLAQDVAAVVVSGDFMSKGDWNDQARNAALSEFEALRRALALKKDQIIAVPGNHDIVRYPPDRRVEVADIAVGNQTTYQHEREFRTFIDELIGRNWRESLNYVRRIKFATSDLFLCVINSCTITATQWTEYGYAGPNGLDALRRMAREKLTRPTFKFLALHHHLLPVADVEAPQSKGVTLALDASDVLSEAQRTSVDVVLHGHQHKPKIAVYHEVPLMQQPLGQPIHVIANGSSGAKVSLLPNGERNTYCLFRLDEKGVQLWMRELRVDGRPGAELFSGKLPIAPKH